MTTPELKATNDGLDRVRVLHRAQERLKRAKSEENSASCELANAENELVSWFVPKDAKIGDRYSLPVGDGFLDVLVDQSTAYCVETNTRSTDRNYVVSWRGNRVPSGVL